MGQEQSAITVQVPILDLTSVNINIPPLLRPVFPFLNDSLRFLRGIKKCVNKEDIIGRKKLALSCINSSFNLLVVLNITFDNDANECLRQFNELRNQLGIELNVSLSQIPTSTTNSSQALSSNDILLTEADAILSLAEEELREGIRFEAMMNYHTASVFYRVLISLAPSLASNLQQRMFYAAYKTRQTSPMYQNFVNEYFGDTSCADIYEVHGSNKLGKGSYGSVYLATHRKTGDERAVKVMNVDRVTSYYLRKLHTEIAVLRTVDHPNIIKLQDVFFGRRSVYLVTDLCRGGELFELLNSGKSQGFVFREDRASQLMRDMVSAVHYLHELGIVHRDLKLENFLFEVKSASSPLVLIDFGLSRFFDGDERMNQRVGSCYYTAPEVLSGTYDESCDNWSLGVLCYMLLSGTPPFFGKSVEDVYNATLTQEPSFHEKKFRHVSECCIDFMQRLLVKDPTLRMTTTQALQHPFITGMANIPASLPVAAINVQSQVLVTPNISADSMSNYTDTSRSRTNSGTSFSFGWNPFSNFSSSSSLPSLAPNQPATSQSQIQTLQLPRDYNGMKVSSHRAVLPIDIASSILECLSVYASAEPLIKLTLAMTSHSLSPEFLADIRRVFQSVDVLHCGYISSFDLSAALLLCEPIAAGTIDLELLMIQSKLSSIGLSSDVIAFKKCNSQKSIRLSYHEFVAIMISSRMDIADDRIAVVFSNFDEEKSGLVSGNMLKNYLGEEISDAGYVSIIQSSDWDGDGFFAENDFMQKWRQFHRRGVSPITNSISQTDFSSMPPTYPITSSNGNSSPGFSPSKPHHRRTNSGLRSLRPHPNQGQNVVHMGTNSYGIASPGKPQVMDTSL